MVKVPEYVQNVSLRPNFQQGIDVRASPDDFGAAAGRGMQGLAQGVGQAADAMAQLQALDDANRAKDADNSYSNWLREKMYGEGGYMTLEGRNAVDARAAFEKEADEKRKEFGKPLTGGAARSYSDASQSRLNSVLQQSVVHSAQARKSWFNETSAARVETFANDALENANNPALINKNIAAGILEIREQAGMHGWDAATLTLKEKDFASGVHKNIATRLALADPLAAKTYIDDHAAALTAVDKANLDKALEAPILAEKASRNVASIVGGIAPQTYDEAPGPTRERASRMGLEEPAPKPADSEAVPARVRANEIASKFVGMTERGDAGVISSFIKRSAGLNVDPRVTPWCAAFVNGVLGASGVDGTGKLNARSFLNFGMPTDRPKPGDIVVMSRGDPNGWEGHVGFFQGFDRNGKVMVLGGNQSNRVSVASFDPGKVLGFRTAGTVNEQTAALPNYGPKGLADINAQLMAIKNPKERKETQEALSSYYTLQKKQMDAQREQVQSWAEGELMRNPGMELSKIPLDYQQALGASGMTTLINYQKTLRTSGEPQTDDRTLYDLQTEYAEDPEGFANVDLFPYRDKLSNSDWEKVRGWRQDALTDKRKARENGSNLSAAFSQATPQLEAVGISTAGKKGTAKEDAAKQVVKFHNALADEMETFKRANNNRAPTQIEVQSMINKLLLPVVIKTPGMLWGTNEKPGLAFQMADRPDDSTAELAVDYGDIPIDLRRGIAADLERELGRKPSKKEVEQRYEDFVISR
ncbi:TIGR02594 family protein [Hyphomicrobium sp. ghe19]|uniref:TIGR02594 family protein n=1 Tax=Hyphomicrobium sp. ghe19 TaxID=2682968 RepID=UPI0013676433|nr:hypothetical protein HYPP_01940 [Hyphomicrobium sp. ghe19]